MKALHFGAGNIGRGFIGKLLADSNIQVIFADVNNELIELLEKKKSYNVQIVSNDVKKTETVSNITGINSQNENNIIHLFKDINLITTAVGPNVLKIISSTIAKGIIARFNSGNTQALNIIACENMVCASTFLKENVFKYLTTEMQKRAEELIGFVDSAVDRIVPPTQNSKNDPLLVTVEEFNEWIVDQKQFKGGIPNIAGMIKTDNLIAFVERKLFTLNTGHAATAYLGKIKGYNLIDESINDPNIRYIVREAMRESGEVLIKRYNFSPIEHANYIEKILKRFANPYLQDNVDRVAREPLRKLSYNDRLIKPLRGTLEYGLSNTNLIKIIASALAYHNDLDPQSIELSNMLNKDNLENVIKTITELKNTEIVQKIIIEYNAIRE